MAPTIVLCVSIDSFKFRELINLQLGWKGTTLVMLKTQIGLGVLTIPEVFSVLGLIPGVICIVIVGSMITWSNVIVGDFKRNHPEIYGIQDVGRMFLGRFGYEFFGWLFILCEYANVTTRHALTR